MNFGYARDRLEFLNILVDKKRSDVMYGRLWTLEPQHLRFKHGESITELKVPYHMGADDEACVEEAINGITSLLGKRHQSPEGRESAPRPGPLGVKVPALREKTYRTDIFRTGSFEQKLAREVCQTVPAMDSSIMAAWLAPDGRGTSFVKWLQRLLVKAMKDEAKSGWEERTSYLALLAAINTIRKKKEKIKDVRIRGLSYEKTDLAVGLTLFAAVTAAVDDLTRRLREESASYLTPFTEALLKSAVVPKAFLTIPQNILSTSLNPYRLDEKTFNAIKPYAVDFGEEIPEKGDWRAKTKKRVRSDARAMEAVSAQYDLMRFRDEVLKFFSEFDTPGVAAQEMLYDIYGEDRLIRNTLADQRASVRLTEALDELIELYSRDRRRAFEIGEFKKFIASFRKSVLGGLFGGSKTDNEALEAVVSGFYACAFDDHVERFEGLMRSFLADRRGEFDSKMLKEEYSRGRLYRFSTDERAVLKTLEVGEESQLFVDMKDFTRKTLKIKEIAMADFMKDNFYKPILSAASRHSVGSGVTEDESGVRLNNLPGDAAIFSGGIVHMVELARNIQKVIKKYKDTLATKLPPRKDAEILQEVHTRFETKRDGLKEKRKELNRALDRNEPWVQEGLIALGEEEHRLENTYREELEEAIKGELEAGLYIAYGAKAETMVLASVEGFSDAARVTIGEKINEAARGTYRHSMVRAKLEIMLESERRRRKNQDLVYPFDVYIDRIYSLRIPPELEAPFERLIASRKPSGADAMSRIMSNEFHNDLKKIISGETFSNLRLINAVTDIYNKGYALSSAALHAYMRESRGQKFFFHKTVECGDLHESILERFFLPYDSLEFWVGHEVVKGGERLEVFFKSGEVIFKGFEANTPTTIFEMVNPEGEFFKALAEHHLRGWMEEAKKNSTEDL